MVKVDEYARVRRAHRDGMSIRELARRFRHSRRKIREIIATPEPRPYLRLNPPASVLDPYKPIIDAIMAADEQAPRKQRHTASKLYRRLKAEHGYLGGYERIRLYVRSHRRSLRETYIPLDHDPGQRLEADFGHIYVELPEGRRQVPVLVTTWSYSNCPFAIALPTERTEAILIGLAQALEFYGCVPRELWWDNATGLVSELFVGRQRRIHERYQALASHYNFEPQFCLARRPQEKPRVEGRVQFLQQEWATPVPSVKDLAELNARLRACCAAERERVQQGQAETIGVRFERDRAGASALPRRGFDACIRRPAKVDKYQTVRFDHNSYSVPRVHAFGSVTVKGYIEHVEVVAIDQVIARHPRCYGKGEQVLDPLHYLASLGRKPAALDHANVYRHWRLPTVFGELRTSLEEQQGAAAGARHYIRVLQTLAEHPVARVEAAILQGRVGDRFVVESILDRLRRLKKQSWPPEAHPAVDLSQCPVDVTRVSVPAPDLRRFNGLLSRPWTEESSTAGPSTEIVSPEVSTPEVSTPEEPLTGEEVNDVPIREERRGDGLDADDAGPLAAGEVQPEATAAADDPRRVREAGAGSAGRRRELRAISAAADGAGSDGPGRERAAGADQGCELSAAQGLRQLRLHGPAEPEQSQGSGAGP